jgi:hypothetical protein
MNEGTVSRLSGYDIIVGIDRSGSMGDPGKSGKSKWEEAQEGTKALVREAIKVDSDGVTLCLFNGADTLKEYKNVKDAAVVDQIFTENSPMSGTPTNVLLNKYLGEYLTAKKAGNNPKPIILGVVTDGEPTDRKATKAAIINATKDMEKDGEIGISFIQIGNDPGATSFLQDLDDNLQNEGAKFDIVDTKHMDNIDNLMVALEAALDD